MKGGKTPSKPQKPKEKSVKTNPDEKVIEKPVEKTTELVDNDKKPIEEPKLEEKSTDNIPEPTEAPPAVPKQEDKKPTEEIPEPTEAAPEVPKQEDTETIVKHVVETFKNSEDIGEALNRLATEIPVALLLNFFDKFLAIIEGVLAKIQSTLGIEMELKDPEKAMEQIKENLPKIKFRLLLTGVILKEIAQDPEIMKVWTEFIEIFQDKYFQPFLIATLATLQEFEPQIEAQGDKVAKIVSKVVNRTGDAVSDAFGNVIAGVPYIGTVVAGIGAADNLAKVIIANINGWGELFLETSYRLSVTLKKVSPNGLMALDGAIDMVINAYNTYLAVKNSIDKWNALAQNVKFDPDQGYNAEKLTEMMMSKAESAGTLPSQAAPEIPVAEAVPVAEAEPVKKPIDPKAVPE
tara:strand:+ start:14 stop:1231 length:1218 start_codon:yes stop_codon:yes gene_type:complete